MIGYKGFNYKLQGCNKFQFQEGQTYKIEGNLKMCKNGFHFCDIPLNVLDYYYYGTKIYKKSYYNNFLLKIFLLYLLYET